jgi:hypothetical protein
MCKSWQLGKRLGQAFKPWRQAKDERERKKKYKPPFFKERLARNGSTSLLNLLVRRFFPFRKFLF